jgi:hypothetical protein
MEKKERENVLFFYIVPEYTNIYSINDFIEAMSQFLHLIQ